MESGLANATEFTNASTVCPESNRPELPETVSESISSGKEDPPRPLKTLSISPLKGENPKSPFKGDLEGRERVLNARQRKALHYYLDVFALERDTMVSRYVQYTDHQTFSLSLANPQFSYMSRKKMFKFTLEPILGMDIYGAKKGAILKRWYGAELRMDIARHLSIWGSLRDISWNGTALLSDNYYANEYAKIDGAKLTKPLFLNNLAGVQY